MEQSWLHKKGNLGRRKGRQLVAGMWGSSLGCDCSTDHFSSLFFAFCFSLPSLSLFSGLKGRLEIHFPLVD